MDIQILLFNLVIASNRLKKSKGAAILVDSWASSLLAARTAVAQTQVPIPTAEAIQRTIIAEIQTIAARVMDGAVNDPLGLARGQLILSIANVKAVSVFTRSYSAYVLSRGVDAAYGLNGMGRFFYRSSLIKAYLSTNPSLDDATKVLVPVLDALNDPIVKSPLTHTILAQYPELWRALSVDRGGT